VNGTPIELTLDTPRGRLAGLRWGPRNGRPVLAVHGWLDNAGSFIDLADAWLALDPNIDLVALDWPGHGHSAHRADGAWYHLVDYLDDLDAMLDALGWSHCELLGHSLGGAVATMYAVAAPERINRLMLIEALGPLPWREGSAAAALAGARRDRRGWKNKQLRVFQDPTEAILARQKANGLSEHAATRLVDRSLAPVEGGYVWRSDPRLTLTTPLRASEAQIREWVAAIECPTLLIGAEPSSNIIDARIMDERFALLRSGQQVLLPGGHHLHMETPGTVARALHDFCMEIA